MLGWDKGEKEIEMISDNVFGFVDEESSQGSDDWTSEFGSDHEQEDGESGTSLSTDFENKNFWETQNQLLQATVCRTSSLESKIRNIVKQALKEAEEEEHGGQMGGCSRNKGGLMKEICNRLHHSGFNSAICNSKWGWRNIASSGEHTFVHVLETRTNGKRQGGDQDVTTTTTTTTTRVIIELNLRGEFEMGRATHEYKALMTKVPQVYVAKSHRFLSLINILSTCAKKSFKDQHMHLGPWRRHTYFQAKWFQVSLRTTPSPAPPLSHTSHPDRSHLVRRPPRRSMLTLDLLDDFPCSTLPVLHTQLLLYNH